MNTIKLRGPNGCDEANLAGRMFHPHDDGYFHIDADLDVQPLLKVGGFSIAGDMPAAPVAEKQPTTIDDVEALARTLPVGELKARLLAAIAAVAKAAPRLTAKVRPPSGTTGFSHGDRHYEVGDDGLINAPIESLDSILDGPAGFSLAPVDPPPSALADDEKPADDSEPAPVEAIEPAADNPPAAEIDDAPPFHRLVIPVIPSVSLAAA